MQTSTTSRIRNLTAATALCLSLSAARATVLVSIPFDYTGTLPQSLNSFNSANLTNASGITGNFSSGGGGSLTAGAALSYHVGDGGNINAGSSGLSLSSGNNISVAYSPAVAGQTFYARFLYNPGAGTRLILCMDNRIDNSGNSTGSVNAPQHASPRFDLNNETWTVGSFAMDGTAHQVTPAGVTESAINTTYLVVGRFNWNGTGYGSVDLWVNPLYNNGTPLPPNVTAAAPSGGVLYTNFVGPTFWQYSGSASVSGFVIATAWSNVVPPLVSSPPHTPVTYYVATNGNDANSGTNLASPFRNIQKAASLVQAGDTCYIRQGTYRETVTPFNSGTSNAPVTFAAYNGEPVVVSGADVLSASWSVYSNSIYKASTALSFRQLFVDGAMMNEARWPNALVDNPLEITQSAVMVGNPNANAYNTDNTNLVDTALPNGNLVGATLHILASASLANAWAAYTRTITGYDQVAKKLTWANGWSSGGGASYNVTPGNKYYLFGALSLLDTPTEWFLGGGTLYLWTPDGASPAAHTVEVKMRASAVVLDNCSYVTVSNLYVFAAGISMVSSINCVVDNCHLRYVQHNTTADWQVDAGTPIPAACTVGGSGSVWRNSSVRFSSQDGIQLNGTGAIVTNCVVSDVGYYLGSGYSAVTTASGSGHKIVGNTLARSGSGLIVPGALQGPNRGAVSIEVAYNDLSLGGFLVTDVGACYAGFHHDLAGTRIHHNWA
ncbi:MAG: hypothetical protein WCL11_20770, partial [Verrucomicrobiota bacterium]